MAASDSSVVEHPKQAREMGVTTWAKERGGELSSSMPKHIECTNLETQAEPQQIVAQGLLSCLQYPVS